MPTTETFDKRAAQVKNTVAEYKGVTEVEKGKKAFSRPIKSRPTS
jgi:hypothetical protein